MFEAELAEKAKRIFDLKKVTYDLPGESLEQECLFIEVEKCTARVKEARVSGKVTGKIKLYAPSTKLPFGYFAKQIAKADPSDTVDFLFLDIEENTNQFQNIVQRTVGFVYIFNSQYDPEVGSITSVEETE